MEVLVATALLLIGVLMVSTFRYASLKKVDLRKRWSFRALVPIVAIILVFFYLREAAFLALAVVYTLSGPIAYAIHRLRHGRSNDRIPPAQVPAP